MIKKYLGLGAIALFFVACSTKTAMYDTNNELLIGKKESPVKISFTSPKTQSFVSNCVFTSSITKDENSDYGYLLIDRVNLKNHCTWNGLPSGYFVSSIKENFKLDSLTTVEEFYINGYTFKTLEANNDSYLNMISINSGKNDMFIYDPSGKLYDKLLKSFKSDYENKFLAKKRFTGKYYDSLVRKDLVNNYFESEEVMR